MTTDVSAAFDGEPEFESDDLNSRLVFPIVTQDGERIRLAFDRAQICELAGFLEALRAQFPLIFSVQ